MQNPRWLFFLSNFLGAYSGSEDHLVNRQMSFPVHMKTDGEELDMRIDWRTNAMKIVSWIPVIEIIIDFYTITSLDDPALFINGKSKWTTSSRKRKTKARENEKLFWKLNFLFPEPATLLETCLFHSFFFNFILFLNFT